MSHCCSISRSAHRKAGCCHDDASLPPLDSGILHDLYVRSRSEARALFREVAPTLLEAIARAKANADLPDEDWAYLEQLAARIAKRDCRRALLSERCHQLLERLYLRRKLVVACAVLSALLAYLTLVPSGRTLAKQIFDYIMTVVGGTVEVENAAYPTDDSGRAIALYEEEYYATYKEYPSIEAFTEETGIVPFSIRSERIKLLKICEEDTMFDGKRIWMDYQLDKNNMITVFQQWLENDSMHVFSDTFSEKMILESGDILYYSMDEEDGSVNAIIELSDSIVQINIENQLSFENLLKILNLLS